MTLHCQWGQMEAPLASFERPHCFLAVISSFIIKFRTQPWYWRNSSVGYWRMEPVAFVVSHRLDSQQNTQSSSTERVKESQLYFRSLRQQVRWLPSAKEASAKYNTMNLIKHLSKHRAKEHAELLQLNGAKKQWAFQRMRCEDVRNFQSLAWKRQKKVLEFIVRRCSAAVGHWKQSLPAPT